MNWKIGYILYFIFTITSLIFLFYVLSSVADYYNGGYEVIIPLCILYIAILCSSLGIYFIRLGKELEKRRK